MKLAFCAVLLLTSYSKGDELLARGGAISSSPHTVSIQLLDDLALLSTGTLAPPELVATERKKIEQGAWNAESYVDALLSLPAAASYAPSALFPQVSALDRHGGAVDEALELQSTQDKEGRLLYLRAPCARAAAEPVHPWWDFTSTVWVCKDAHLPDHLVEPTTGVHCGGTLENRLAVSKSNYCGCGPNLIYCMRDSDEDEFQRSTIAEFNDTVGYVVSKDLPLKTLFTTNETIRNRYAELIYRRWRVTNGESPATVFEGFDQWSAKSRLAAREELAPGAHAGLLTTSRMVYLLLGPRERMQVFGETLWCIEPKSLNVATSVFLQLPTANIRNSTDGPSGWQKLASMPVCETCHARLDYGLRFFRGFESPSAKDFLVSAQSPEVGELRLNRLSDLRGVAPATPLGFAQLAVSQPEFSSCMTKKVTDHVFGPDASPADRSAVRNAFAARDTYRSAMRTALLRFAMHHEESVASPGHHLAAAPPSTPTAGGTLRVSPALRKLLDRDCVDCHDSGANRVDLRPSALSRALLFSMIDQVATQQMPRSQVGIVPSEREALIDSLVDILWSSRAERFDARRYFGGHMRALPILRGDVITRLIDQRADAPFDGDALGATSELGRTELQYTPGVAALLSLEALRACKASPHKTDLGACVDRSLSPAGITVTSHP